MPPRCITPFPGKPRPGPAQQKVTFGGATTIGVHPGGAGGKSRVASAPSPRPARAVTPHPSSRRAAPSTATAAAAAAPKSILRSAAPSASRSSDLRPISTTQPAPKCKPVADTSADINNMGFNNVWSLGHSLMRRPIIKAKAPVERSKTTSHLKNDRQAQQTISISGGDTKAFTNQKRSEIKPTKNVVRSDQDQPASPMAVPPVTPNLRNAEFNSSGIHELHDEYQKDHQPDREFAQCLPCDRFIQELNNLCITSSSDKKLSLTAGSVNKTQRATDYRQLVKYPHTNSTGPRCFCHSCQEYMDHLWNPSFISFSKLESQKREYEKHIIAAWTRRKEREIREKRETEKNCKEWETESGNKREIAERYFEEWLEMKNKQLNELRNAKKCKEKQEKYDEKKNEEHRMSFQQWLKKKDEEKKLQREKEKGFRDGGEEKYFEDEMNIKDYIMTNRERWFRQKSRDIAMKLKVRAERRALEKQTAKQAEDRRQRMQERAWAVWNVGRARSPKYLAIGSGSGKRNIPK